MADIQSDFPADRTLKLSLSLMMDQKASLLISGIGRREGAGHMLEPSVLHLWNADDHKLCERHRDSSNQTPFNGCYMPNPVHHRTPWHSGARQVGFHARTVASVVPSAWSALPLDNPTACSLTSSRSLLTCHLSGRLSLITLTKIITSYLHIPFPLI